MWTDHYLKFDNEAAWLAAIPTEWQGEDGPVLASTQHALDVVGVIIRGDVELEGYHVNVRVKGDLLDDLQPYIVIPENPARMFA